MGWKIILLQGRSFICTTRDNTITTSITKYKTFLQLNCPASSRSSQLVRSNVLHLVIFTQKLVRSWYGDHLDHTTNAMDGGHLLWYQYRTELVTTYSRTHLYCDTFCPILVRHSWSLHSFMNITKRSMILWLPIVQKSENYRARVD